MLIFLLGVVLALKVPKNVLLSDVRRTTDISQRYVKSESKITLVNSGITSVDKFYHVVHNSIVDTLYHIHVTLNGQEIQGKIIADIDTNVKQNSTLFEFNIQAVNEKLEFELVEMYFNRYTPLPRQVKLEDDQSVVFTDSVFFYSPYHITNQITEVIAGEIISYTYKDAIQRKHVLEYGPFQEIRPYTQQPSTIHYKNNSPHVTFKKALKTIELSHWGNILIEESYTIVNNGAELKGEFGRVAFNKYNTGVGLHSLKSLNSQLPIDTWGIYYRDEIGNISTSNAARGKVNGETAVLVQLRPRFAIFGGWKSNFVLGYNLPTKKYLSSDSYNYELTQHFAFSIKDMVAEEYELRVILPEGSDNIKWEMPEGVTVTKSLTFSYLDTAGRPTYHFTKKLTSQQDNHEIKIKYQFSSLSLFREPLMILTAFLVIFAVVIAANRIELVTLKLKNL